MVAQPNVKAAESSDNDGVQISGVKRRRTTALEHNVGADRTDSTAPLGVLHLDLHLQNHRAKQETDSGQN